MITNESHTPVIAVPERVHPINADGSLVSPNELAFIRSKQRRYAVRTPVNARSQQANDDTEKKIVTGASDYRIDSLRDGLLKDLSIQFKNSALVNDPLATSGALFTIASLIGNKFRLTHDDQGFTHQSIAMFFLLVGPARVTRKSTLIQNHVQKFVREVTGAGFVDECTPEAIHEELWSQGMDNVNIYFDEIRALIGEQKQYSAGLMTAITKMFNGGSWTRSLKSNMKKAGGSMRRTVENFTINVCACSTPDWLFQHATAESFCGGFLVRFIPVCVRADDPAVLLDVDSPAEREAFVHGLPMISIGSLLNRLKHFYKRVHGASQRKINLSIHAQTRLSEYSKSILGQKMDEIETVLFDGIRENVRRVAAVMEIAHQMDNETYGHSRSAKSDVLEVSDESMREAIGFIRQLYTSSLQTIRHHFSTSKVEADAKVLLREILALKPKQTRYNHEGQVILAMPKTTITRGTRLSGGNREAALRELVARDILEGPLIIPSSNPKARKPVQIFVIAREQWD